VAVVNNLSQLAAVFAIAGGSGLLAFSRHIDPPVIGVTNQEVMMSMNSRSREDRQVAATAGGFGTAFITLGSLTLAVPWINCVLKQQTASTETTTS
jgi:hypothetical protein